MASRPRLRLELELEAFNRLHAQSQAVRSSSATVKVDRKLLDALLRDHAKACAALEGRGILVEDTKGEAR